MKCQINCSNFCEKTIKKGKEKFINGKVCCEWCYNKTKRENNGK